MRTEVAISTNVGWVVDMEQQPQLLFTFNGRRFVWHATRTVPEPGFGDYLSWPIVTVTNEEDDYQGGIQAINRFLSALSYVTRHKSFVSSAAAGLKQEFDVPLLGGLGARPMMLVEAPASINRGRR
jgi:hypothetical protein